MMFALRKMLACRGRERREHVEIDDIGTRELHRKPDLAERRSLERDELELGVDGVRIAQEEAAGPKELGHRSLAT
jgi:hypothetical protein